MRAPWLTAPHQPEDVAAPSAERAACDPTAAPGAASGEEGDPTQPSTQPATQPATPPASTGPGLPPAGAGAAGAGRARVRCWDAAPQDGPLGPATWWVALATLQLEAMSAQARAATRHLQALSDSTQQLVSWLEAGGRGGRKGAHLAGGRLGSPCAPTLPMPPEPPGRSLPASCMPRPASASGGLEGAVPGGSPRARPELGVSDSGGGTGVDQVHLDEVQGGLRMLGHAGRGVPSEAGAWPAGADGGGGGNAAAEALAAAAAAEWRGGQGDRAAPGGEAPRVPPGGPLSGGSGPEPSAAVPSEPLPPTIEPPSRQQRVAQADDGFLVRCVCLWDDCLDACLRQYAPACVSEVFCRTSLCIPGPVPVLTCTARLDWLD
jgi:hypothetical protein